MSIQIDQRSYVVSGMTCSHCAQAVQTELSSVEGVESVDVDLQARNVTVSGRSFDDASIREAVEEAGYQVSG